MVRAAARAIVHQANPTKPGDSLLPDVQNLRDISAAVAEAAYRAATSRARHDVVSGVRLGRRRQVIWRPRRPAMFAAAARGWNRRLPAGVVT
jgi:malate dehydrogenase (oxaloacetate-decarboxylating)